MSKWTTFYYDVMRNTISDMQVHNSKDGPVTLIFVMSVGRILSHLLISSLVLK